MCQVIFLSEEMTFLTQVYSPQMPVCYLFGNLPKVGQLAFVKVQVESPL